MPTFCPGRYRVPRCRTSTLPAGTVSPPNRLIPSRCALLSRPFRELLPPFLCATAGTSQLDPLDPHPAERLPVPDPAAIVLLRPELADDHLAAPSVRQHLRHHLRALDDRSAAPHVVGVDNHQHASEHDLGPFVRREAVHFKDLAFLDPHLLSASVDYRVHTYSTVPPQRPAKAGSFIGATRSYHWRGTVSNAGGRASGAVARRP